jgi:transglutaminase-like putative cysteine protease
LLFGVCLCVVGLALAAPQVGTTVPPVTEPFADAETASEYGPVQGSYFRAMSYDRYTGTGWERTADAEPLASLDRPPAGGDVLRVRYEVRAPVRTAPAPWRPTAYDGPDAVAVDGAIEPAATYGEGDEFTVTSRRPAADASTLARAGADYPAGIDRYRRLPDDTPPALARVAANVTDDAETPYATAVAVNRWLRTERNYSLTVDRPADHVATAFVTEMDAGFCQYFATAMVAMVRAEGVPARYVTGYTPYEQVGADEHVVRGKYAHTWVEVYFPDVGWVAFDPTPPDPRRAERGVATVGDDANGSAALRATRATGTTRETASGGWRQLDADIRVDGDITAGANVTVTVRDPDAGTPVEGAQVRFNGRPVGETDADGLITATVPFRAELTVAAYVYDGPGDPPPVVGAAGPGLSESVRDLRYAAPRTEVVGSLTDRSDVVLFRVTVENGTLEPAVDTAGDGPEAALAWRQRRSTRTATQGSELTFGVNTTIDVTVTPASGGPDAERPGESLTVRATIDGRPVPDGTVTAGDRSATTDANGTATIPAPYERPATVTVEREAAAGTATIDVGGELDATARDATVAGEAVRVTATLSDGTPVRGATVTNGVETTTTGADGVATIPAPYEPPWTIAVRRGDYRDEVPVPVETGTGTVELEPIPGSGRGLRATYRGVPVRNATVTVDGDRVARTDGDGRANVTVPFAESTTTVVDRGDVRAERTVDLRTDGGLAVDGLAVPGGTVTVRATVADEPLTGADVLIDGQAVGETNADGAATVRVPVAPPTADLRVRRGAVTAGTGLVGVTVVWATALVGLAGAAVLARRHRPDAGGRWHPRALAAGLRGRDAWAAAATLRVRGPRTLAADLRDRLRATVSALRERTAALLAERDAAAPKPEVTGGTAEHAGPTAPDDVPAAENEVYRAWATFTAGLDVDSESPATAADRAKRAGLPDAAVADLVANFRAVRYGGADATADRERRAREALARIQEASR